VGKTGHGWAWQDVACALEIACRDPRLLGLHLELGRVESLAKEVLGSGVQIPRSGELRERWGIGYDAVVDNIEALKRMKGHWLFG